jgi:hypothetical protein
LVQKKLDSRAFERTRKKSSTHLSRLGPPSRRNALLLRESLDHPVQRRVVARQQGDLALNAGPVGTFRSSSFFFFLLAAYRLGNVSVSGSCHASDRGRRNDVFSLDVLLLLLGGRHQVLVKLGRAARDESLKRRRVRVAVHVDEERRWHQMRGQLRINNRIRTYGLRH